VYGKDHPPNVGTIVVKYILRRQTTVSVWRTSASRKSDRLSPRHGGRSKNTHTDDTVLRRR